MGDGRRHQNVQDGAPFSQCHAKLSLFSQPVSKSGRNLDDGKAAHRGGSQSGSKGETIEAPAMLVAKTRDRSPLHPGCRIRLAAFSSVMEHPAFARVVILITRLDRLVAKIHIF